MTLRLAREGFEVKSEGEGTLLDITGRIQKILADSGLSDGLATIFVSGSTAAITTIEYEPGLLLDFPAMLDRVAPKSGAVTYEHQRKWHDGNGHSHVKASLVGPSITIPFVDGSLALGEWQQVVMVELDIRPRTRKILVHVIGEG